MYLINTNIVFTCFFRHQTPLLKPAIGLPDRRPSCVISAAAPCETGKEQRVKLSCSADTGSAPTAGEHTCAPCCTTAHLHFSAR